MLRGALSIPENRTEVSTQNSTAIQEAHGGRKGDDTEYREYTPVTTCPIPRRMQCTLRRTSWSKPSIRALY